MRLIDADALLLDNTWEWYDEYGNLTVAGRAVENAPTVDPFKDKSLEALMDDAFTRGYYNGREVFNRVKHGWWKHSEYAGIDYYQCNLCGKSVRHTAENYCPNCGAKMDGGTEHETD